jgi:endonuclease/exonuclease/phosphatase family metal-dependent hydrolase
MISSGIAKEKPVILMGDFNSYENQGGYQVVTGFRYTSSPPSHPPSPPPQGISFLDFHYELHRSNSGEGISTPFGEDMTFTGFQKSDTRGRIDFLMVADNGVIRDDEGKGNWRVSRYGVIDNRKDGGFFVSDHRMVVGRLDYLG